MENDPDLELAEQLRAAVSEFVRHVRAYNTMPAGQAGVLGHLVRAGALPIAELARREQVKHQSMTRTVGLLAEQGLVTLGTDERDRRQVLVTATSAGLARIDEQRRFRATHIAAALDRLADEDRAVAARIPAVLRQLLA